MSHSSVEVAENNNLIKSVVKSSARNADLKLKFQDECIKCYDKVKNEFHVGFKSQMRKCYGSSAYRWCKIFKEKGSIIVAPKQNKLHRKKYYNKLNISPGRIKMVSNTGLRNIINEIGTYNANSYCKIGTQNLHCRLNGAISVRTAQRILHYELHAKILTIGFSVSGYSTISDIEHNLMESEDEWLLQNDIKIVVWEGVEFPSECINKSFISYNHDGKAGQSNFTFTPKLIKSEIFCKCYSCQFEKQQIITDNKLKQKQQLKEHKKHLKQQLKLAFKRKQQHLRQDIFVEFITDLGIKQVVCRRRAKYVALMENDNSSADDESSGECRWKYGESRSDMYKAEDELSSTNFSLSTVSVTVSDKSSVHEWEDMEECNDEERDEELNDILGVLNGLRSQREVSKRNSAKGVFVNANWEEEDLLESDCSDNKKERKGEKIIIPSSMEVLSADEDGGRAVTGLFKPSDESDTESAYSSE
jgi:hypothetical protein